MQILNWILGSKWLWFVLGAIALYYFGFPLLIYLTFANEAEPTVDTFDPRERTLPPRVHEHFRVTCDELLPLGFEFVAGMSLPQAQDNAMAILILLTNRQAQDSAIAVSMFAKENNEWNLRTNYVEYSSTFADGMDVNTMNSNELTAFKVPAQTRNYSFPMIANSVALYELHRQMAARDGGTQPKVLPLDRDFKGDPVAYIQASIAKELVAATKDGYLYLSKSQGKYRATIKGALIMTWQELWPLKSIRLRKRDALARRRLAELGFNAADFQPKGVV